MSSNTVKPELAGGFRDYLPADQIARQKMLDTIKRTFERFGFVPLETPALEKVEVLTGGDPGFDKQIFRARLADDQENTALRFDLTVPLARVVAANSDKLDLPFKRYQIGKVWRGEKQQVGRYREFMQCDIDIVGSDNTMADAEIVAVIYQTLTDLGLTEFVVKVNNRKILQEIPENILREIDKIDKVGWAGVSSEAQAYKEFFAEPKTNDELAELITNARILGVPEEKILIDNTIVRGLSYYTGNIFEAVLTNGSLGSIFSGGRYDDLVSRFAPLKIPAVGASLGLDRLFVAMDELGLIERKKNPAKVLVLNFEPSCRPDVQRIAAQLRQAGVSAELYLGQEDTLKGQLAYGVKGEYPLVVFLGEQEKTSNTVQIKDMNAREQKEVPQDNLVQAIRK